MRWRSPLRHFGWLSAAVREDLPYRRARLRISLPLFRQIRPRRRPPSGSPHEVRCEFSSMLELGTGRRPAIWSAPSSMWPGYPSTVLERWSCVNPMHWSSYNRPTPIWWSKNLPARRFAAGASRPGPTGTAPAGTAAQKGRGSEATALAEEQGPASEAPSERALVETVRRDAEASGRRAASEQVVGAAIARRAGPVSAPARKQVSGRRDAEVSGRSHGAASDRPAAVQSGAARGGALDRQAGVPSDPPREAVSAPVLPGVPALRAAVTEARPHGDAGPIDSSPF